MLIKVLFGLDRVGPQLGSTWSVFKKCNEVKVEQNRIRVSRV